MSEPLFGPISREVARMTVLRLSVRRAGAEPAVVLELEVSGSVIATWWVGAKEMVVPPSSARMRGLRLDQLVQRQGLMAAATDQLTRFISERRVDWFVNFMAPKATIPDRLLRSLSRALHNVPEWDGVMWLEFADSATHLAQMPWERLLRRRIPVSVLRLPYHSVKPLVTSSSLEMVLCCSAAAAGDLLPEADLDCLVVTLGALPRKSMLRVFADGGYRSRVAGLLRAKLGADAFDVQAYEGPSGPADGEARQAGEEDDPAANHPWLSWLADGLAGKAVDLVHFVVGARWSGERSFLAISRYPGAGSETPANLLRLVSVAEVERFLNGAGASTVVFTATGDAEARFALCHFADALARLRPGAIAVHDPSLDPDWSGLAATLQFLFSTGDAAPPRSDGITLVCHPWKLQDAMETAQDQEIVRRFLETSRIVKQVVDGTDTPSWVASSQRYLEKAVSRCIETTSTSDLEKAADLGHQEALSNLSEVLAAHVSSLVKPR